MSETDEEDDSEEEKEESDDEEDEDERYREGMRYSGRRDEEEEDSPIEEEEEEEEKSTAKKQVRFLDSVQEPSSRDPDQFRSNPLWKMMQAASLQDKPETSVPVRKVTPADLKVKEPSQTTSPARTSIMSQVVVENEITEPVDVDELELAIDMQVVMIHWRSLLIV